MDVRIFGNAAEAHAAGLAEVAREIAKRPAALLCFATGATYAPLYAALAKAVAAGEVDLGRVVATHLDEYLGHGPRTPHGFAHELVTSCPPLAALLAQGRFLCVPGSGDAAELRAHEADLAARGGIDLVLLGIGRNGHIAFNEPGTPFELGFHRTVLAATTREDARARFAPAEPPREAVTAGPRTILGARRVVLTATGAAKAPAVAAMLEGPIGVACPASALRRHERVTVLLDEAAASQLSAPGRRRATGSAHDLA